MRISAILKTASALTAAALLASGCSGEGQSRPAASPPALVNPLDFPLYPHAAIVSTRAFTQKVDTHGAQNGVTVFDAGNGTYAGHEVIASSSAPFAALSQWVEHVNASPPPGYSAVETGDNPDEHVQAERYGIDYATFRRTGKNRGVLVIVMDPQRVNKKFGAVLGMISKYRSLPAMMRAPIDNEAKSRIGMTISEATAPESPIGAALAALDQLQNKNARGIVVIDAAKR